MFVTIVQYFQLKLLFPVSVKQAEARRDVLVPVEDSLLPSPPLHRGHHLRGHREGGREVLQLQHGAVPHRHRAVRESHSGLPGSGRSKMMLARFDCLICR